MEALWQHDFAAPSDVMERAARIRLLLLDVDGVLTDGKIRLTEAGEEIKAFNALDGHGIKLLRSVEVETGVITARSSGAVTRRLKELGVDHYFQGQQDKREAFAQLTGALKISTDQVAYVGDDVIDLPVMRQCGLAVSVPNAHAVVRQLADWQTPVAGGSGAVRCVCDLLLVAQGKYDQVMEQYLS